MGSSPKSHAPDNARASSTQRQCVAATQSPRQSPSACPEKYPPTNGLQDIRKEYAEAGLTEDAVNLLMHSWRPSTAKAYDTYIKRWQDYVNRNNILAPSHVDLANLLAALYKVGASHNTINLARSAVSAYLNKNDSKSIGSHPLVCRLLKGIFEQRLFIPRCTETWDTDVVLDCLVEWLDKENINLKELPLRTVILLALVLGQRAVPALLVSGRCKIQRA